MSGLALVTGAGSGLGELIAAELEIQKYTVIGIDHKYGHDVRNGFEADAPWLDVLVNCAGVNRIAWLEDLTAENWHETLDTNAHGIVRMVQTNLTALSKARGTVLNIVSNASHIPMRGSAAYNASKAAAHILTLQMARELYSRHGITVFGISPNRLAGTAMSQQIDAQVVQQRGWTLEEARRYQLASLPTGEETDPRALAEFVGFLLSTKRRHQYLHGCILPYGV
jgi:NAD(P)-dependent dehydrogenase (short-subunit alcohol dehydrogenase family)